MEDMERYGDYNDAEDGAPSRNPIAIGLRIVVVLLCVSVLGLLGYRLFLFDHYPQAMRSLVMTDALEQHFRATDGEIGAMTQSLRFPYDDNKKGRFFCDHMICIPAVGELQVTLRYNVSTLATIEEELGISLADEEGGLRFRLTDNYGRVYDELRYSEYASKSMYRYYRLAFGGIAFEQPEDGKGAPQWIRLDIFAEGVDATYASVLVYENNENYATFSPYIPSKKEMPQ